MKLFARKKDVEAIAKLEEEVKSLEEGINYYYGEADKMRAKVSDIIADLEFLPEFSEEWTQKCQELQVYRHYVEMYDESGDQLHERADQLRDELSKLNK